MSGAACRKLLVVVVEDARECSAALEIALSRSGRFLVRAFGSAEEALEAMQSAAPDAVVTDIHLPGMSGLALIRELRAAYAETNLRIIAVSGGVCQELGGEALAAGADAFFSKPYSPRELCQTLEGMTDGQ